MVLKYYLAAYGWTRYIRNNEKQNKCRQKVYVLSVFHCPVRYAYLGFPFDVSCSWNVKFNFPKQMKNKRSNRLRVQIIAVERRNNHLIYTIQRKESSNRVEHDRDETNTWRFFSPLIMTVYHRIWGSYGLFAICRKEKGTNRLLVEN